MHRHELTDKQYNEIKNLIPGSKSWVGVTAKDNRQFLNAISWILKTGAPWRDLPSRFGKWKSVYNRYSRWCKNDVFKRILSQVSIQSTDNDDLMIDSSTVKAHQHSSNRKAKNIGRSVAGLSTKINCVMSADGRIIDFSLSPGNQHDIIAAPSLIEDKRLKSLIADKAYCSEELKKSQIKK